MSDAKPSEAKPVLMRINIAGYNDQPATLFGAFDPSTSVLAVLRIAREYESGPRDGFLKITNQDADESRDALFTEELAVEAVRAFFDMDSLKLLQLKADAARCNPANKIERDGMDEHGLKYRFAQDIGNQHVAVLAACYFARQQRGAARARSFMKAMQILTI